MVNEDGTPGNFRSTAYSYGNPFALAILIFKSALNPPRRGIGPSMTITDQDQMASQHAQMSSFPREPKNAVIDIELFYENHGCHPPLHSMYLNIHGMRHGTLLSIAFRSQCITSYLRLPRAERWHKLDGNV